MPEYLAPGVYVEETSFRAKSIEGVSTSTTGFVGRTRKGPRFIPDEAEDTPELLTSFGDFERIYGGMDPLVDGAPTYLAHAVQAFFNNGGGRLFVSRVFEAGADAGTAASLNVVDGADDTERARFVSRTPGAIGNGLVTLHQVATPATLPSLGAAPLGTLLRVGTRSPAVAARLEGGATPFALGNDAKLLLTVGGADVEITVHGEPAESFGGAPLANPITIPDPDKTLRVTIDGVDQAIDLPTTATTPADLVMAINRSLRSGYARLSTAAEAPEGRLVIGSDRRGSQARVTVRANASLGFGADADVAGSANPANSVGDLLRVTPNEIDALLVAAGLPVRASVSPTAGRLVLSSTVTGGTAVVRVRDGGNNVNAALGLTGGQEATGSPGEATTYFVKTTGGWQADNGTPLDLSGWQATGSPRIGAELLRYAVVTTDGENRDTVYPEVALDRSHPQWIGNILAPTPARRNDALEHTFAIEVGRNVTAFELRQALFPTDAPSQVALQGGNDGAQPTATAYERALLAFVAIEDISIVAAPDGADDATLAQGIHNALIAHVERRRAYRIAVLDVPPERSPMEALEVRSRIDSNRAALYYPWVTVPNPLARPGRPDIPAELSLPPSGFVCGIYARSDVQRGVFKAPANEVVLGALRFESDINFAQQELLNPAGVNCLRFFPGRGYRVWGARTSASDPEWKYVNIRRYFNYLEHSIDRGTQWAVFEPNGERLWANIRETVSGFLYNEWVSGALLGESPKEAFFVRCDRSTMTQNDLDNGRLICLIGVAALTPAEFVIFRIGQKTADSRT